MIRLVFAKIHSSSIVIDCRPMGTHVGARGKRSDGGSPLTACAFSVKQEAKLTGE